MRNKISKKKLKKMILCDFNNLSTDEIKALIQKELDKDVDDIDTDYIDLCFELLSVKNNNQNKKKIKFNKPVKVLLTAALLTVILVSAVTVTAQLHLNIPENIAKLVDGNAEITDYNLENTDTTADGYALLDTDFAKKLKDYGIDPITFPEEMTKENCTITDIEVVNSDELSVIIDVCFEYNGQEGSLYIYHMLQDMETAGSKGVMDIKSGQIIRANGMDILVFEQDDSCTLLYKDNLTSYDMSLDCDLETAIEFAKSIK